MLYGMTNVLFISEQYWSGGECLRDINIVLDMQFNFKRKGEETINLLEIKWRFYDAHTTTSQRQRQHSHPAGTGKYIIKLSSIKVYVPGNIKL